MSARYPKVCNIPQLRPGPTTEGHHYSLIFSKGETNLEDRVCRPCGSKSPKRSRKRVKIVESGFQRGVFARGDNLKELGSCVHRLQYLILRQIPVKISEFT